jgi:hypothetical protein
MSSDSFKYIIAPAGFWPHFHNWAKNSKKGGPKPEEAYIEVPARNMISIYIYTVYTRSREI